MCQKMAELCYMSYRARMLSRALGELIPGFFRDEK